MPAVPYVFRPVKSGDVQVRPFKTYKSYQLSNIDDYSGSGYRVHNGLHNIYAVHVGVNSYNYLTNSIDNTNQHVVWRNIDHRYYRYPYDPSRCHELTNIRTTEKYLHYSASILTIPYFDVGERIKPGSVLLYGTPVNTRHTLVDDGYGNLRDPLINTSSFASSSNLLFYMSFNNEFRKFEKQFDTIETGSISYKLNLDNLQANCQGIEIIPGVTLSNNKNSGTGIRVDNTINGYIHVPHNDKLNQFNKKDKWTVSFWYYVDAVSSSLAPTDGAVIMSKYATKLETYVPLNTKVQTTRTVNLPIPSFTSSIKDWNKLRTPMHLELVSDNGNDYIRYVASNGTNALMLSGSWGTDQAWHHCALINDGCDVKLYIDGIAIDSGSVPIGIVGNSSDLIIGNYSTDSRTNIPIKLDEIRIYNYNINTDSLTSLRNNHYLSSSLYQTNVAGNVFYRNAQIVVTSPLEKYNSGSGFLRNEWTASWQGTYTVYENEVMVRIPSEYFNYTMNPTATYRPVTDQENLGCGDTAAVVEKYNGPGELFKSMFTSSFVTPYITSVGLYNDKAQLLAIGKLAQPVQKRDDVDMNIIVRWDY